MKKKLSIVCFLFFILNIVAQVPSFVWAKGVVTSVGVVGRNLGVDVAGNTYISGDLLGTGDFDPGPGVYNLSSVETCCNDIFILKLDPSGNFMWAKQIGGTNFDRCKGMYVDTGGNVFLTGTFGGTPDFDPGPGTYTLSQYGMANMFACKLDASGNFVWAKQFAGTGLYGDSNDITADASGNVYITGNFSDTCDFDPGPGIYQLIGDTAGAGGNNGDIFVCKLNSNGNFVWAKQMGDITKFDDSNGIVTDASGNVYTTGLFGGNGDFDPGPGTYILNALGTDPNRNNVFVSKLNASGNFVWAKAMGYETASGNAIKLGSTGKVYVGGAFYLTGDFDPGAGTYTLSSAGINDNFVAALTANGNFLWAASQGGIDNDELFSLAVDQYDNIYTAGRFRDVADMDPGPGTFTIATTAFNDIFVSKLDANGNFLNAGAMGGGDNDLAFAVGADNAGNIYSAGYFRATADFYPGPSTYNFSTSTNAGLFISKLCTTPAVPVNVTSSSNVSACSGQSATLSVSSAGTVNWYATSTSTTVLASGNSFYSPLLSPGTYTYYAESNACLVNPIRTAVSITINPTPAVNALSSNTLICAGQTSTLTASGASTYSWNNSATGASITVSPTVTTNYIVTGTSTNGCSSSFAVTQTVSACAGIEVNNVQSGMIKIFPNPTSGDFSIEMADKVIISEIYIYNITGEIIYRSDAVNTMNISLKKYPVGMYYIKIISNKKEASIIKVIKN